jgi:hypothetical protein
MPGTSAVRHLERGRTGYWDEGSQTIVIHDPSTEVKVGGTVMKSGKGRKRFDRLEKNKRVRNEEARPI